MENETPSIFLPPLSKLHLLSTADITHVLEKLEDIYRPSPPQQVHSIAAAIVAGLNGNFASTCLNEMEWEEEPFIDSGYASADSEESFEEDEAVTHIRDDSFEKDTVIRWITGFITRSPSWSCPLSPPLSDEEAEVREDIVDRAASLITVFSGMGDEAAEPALTRRFEFAVGDGAAGGENVVVELNDEPLSASDHSSVGLQSWASSIVMAKLICADARRFSLTCGGEHVRITQHPPRILELGAGTGLLSITLAKLFDGFALAGTFSEYTIVASDYHADVLQNLRFNIEINFPDEDIADDCDCSVGSGGGQGAITVAAYDWQFPSTNALFEEAFDVIIAADVIYDVAHAGWIKACLERLLRRPSPDCQAGGVFWLMIPIRTIGRHEGMDRTVLEAFPLHNGRKNRIAPISLSTVQLEEIQRFDGIGRVDESMYKLFKICWA